MKEFIKNVLGKLPIFIFCVVFMSVHNSVYGGENSIIAVVVLTGLFIFMRGTLGINVIQGALSIIVMLLMVGLFPKISLINPILGIFVNTIGIFLILVLSSHDVTQGNHVPFLMGYIFCQGYDVSGKSYILRILSLGISAVIIAIIYYLVNRKKLFKRTVKDLFRELNINSTRTRWYIRMTSTLVLTMFVGDILNYPRTMWVNLTVLSLTTPFENECHNRSKARIPAAIIGTALFYILFEIIVPIKYQGILVLGAGFMAMFIKDYFIKSIYNSFSAMGAAVLIFNTKGAILLRVLSNIYGTIIAVSSYFIFNYLLERLSKKNIIECE